MEEGDQRGEESNGGGGVAGAGQNNPNNDHVAVESPFAAGRPNIAEPHAHPQQQQRLDAELGPILGDRPPPVVSARSPTMRANAPSQQQLQVPSLQAVNPQAMLRQQAHSPIAGLNHYPPLFRASAAGGGSSSGGAYANAGVGGGVGILPPPRFENNLPSAVSSSSLLGPERNVDDGCGEFPPTSGWSEVDLSQDPGAGVPPSARSLHAAALLNGVMYVFGGYDGSQRVNTFHAFSFAEKRWSPVLPSANSQAPPSPRDRHVAVAFGNSFYVHGEYYIIMLP